MCKYTSQDMDGSEAITIAPHHLPSLVLAEISSKLCEGMPSQKDKSPEDWTVEVAQEKTGVPIPGVCPDQLAISLCLEYNHFRFSYKAECIKRITEYFGKQML